MLDRLATYAGCPTGHIGYLSLPNEVLLLYPSADTTVILNARTLNLVRVLAFWEAFPSLKYTNDKITCISVDTGHKIVVVAMNSRIAAWSLSGVKQDVWRIHSTLVLSKGQSITTLDSRSGLLAVGTQNGLSVYNSVLENDLPTWSKKWSIKCPTPLLVSFAPSLMYIAAASKNSNSIRIYSTTTGKQTQIIPHPRPVVNLRWRQSHASSRDDMILYTITSDSVLRIFLPVLDAPRTLQLHASLDLFSSLPFSFASIYPNFNSVVWLNGGLIDSVFSHILKTYQSIDDALIRLVKDVVEEKWDLFLRVLPDGSIVVSAVANIDRRPPTLLRQFTLKHTPPHTLSTSSMPTQIHLLPSPDPCMFTLVTSSPLRTYELSPLEFFGPFKSDSSSAPSSPSIPHTSGSPVRGKSIAASTYPRTRTATGITSKEQDRYFDRMNEKGGERVITGLELLVKGMNSVRHEKKAINRFLRTSEGDGVAVLREGGCGEVWRATRRSGFTGEKDLLVHQADFENADFVVVLDQGRSFVTYSATDELLTLHTKYPQEQTHTLSVPKLESLFTYPSATPTPLSTADNASEYSTESVFGITPDCYIVHVRIDTGTDKLVLHSHRRLPLLPPLPLTSRIPSSPSPSNTTLAVVSGSEGSNRSQNVLMNGTDLNAVKRILPVDPMAWGWDPERDRSLSSQLNFANADARNGNNVFEPALRNGRGGWEEHDVLLSVSEGGELAFWVPDNADGNKDARNRQKHESGSSWRCTGRVRTGRTGFNRVRCSSAKKTALVVPSSEGDELTIWDSMESEFASGLEYRGIFEESILDLDWNSTPDMQSILAVGYARHIEILCQQRMTYFDEGPGWALCHRIDITNYTPYSISDSIWLSEASFLVGAGHQMWLYGEPRKIKKREGIEVLDRRTDSVQGVEDEDEETASESLFEYVARQNGPLEDYHPQMLLQCLLWGKVELVKEIITNLAKAVKVFQENATIKGRKNIWTPLPVERFLEHNVESRASKVVMSRKQHNLFLASNQTSESEGEFSRALVTNLIETLEMNPIPHLTPNEHAHLLVLIQTTLDIDEQRRALDANGLRYLISMRSFYILNRRASAPTTPNIKGRLDDGATTGVPNGIPRQTGKRERLRYRDMIWAFHSESQELLVGACIAACNGKMVWSDARALGFPVWLTSIESLKTQLENIARNEYMAGDNRDPVACSLYYFALGKSKLVHGLWRQAAWHKEQAVMLKFLANNFNERKWRTAALKNAYALMGRQRFEYAAAFFLLGGSLKDAVNVCIRQLDDWQLAVALARVVENSNEGPILKAILRDTVLPIAFQTGNRWLGSWAFWLLHRRDLSVRILLTPLQDIAAAFGVMVEEIGEPHYDDPGLALLFAQLRSKTLQAAKGTSEISGRSEFNFVLQMARVFCRMGCHVLALDLVRSWSFERPSIEPEFKDKSAPPSPSIMRRPMFPLEPAMRRRSSILIDMDILSLPPSRSESPRRDLRRAPLTNGAIEEESDLLARKVGLGNLMKTAKQDVQVPEFDMNAFS